VHHDAELVLVLTMFALGQAHGGGLGKLLHSIRSSGESSKKQTAVLEPLVIAAAACSSKCCCIIFVSYGVFNVVRTDHCSSSCTCVAGEHIMLAG